MSHLNASASGGAASRGPTEHAADLFDRYRTFSRGGSYQWMSEQGSNAKDRNTLLRSFLTGVALSACILHTLEIAPGSVADRCCSNRMFRPSVHPSFISSPRRVVNPQRSFRVVFGERHHDADSPYLVGLLRAGRNRPNGYSTTDKGDELAPPHSI